MKQSGEDDGRQRQRRTGRQHVEKGSGQGISGRKERVGEEQSGQSGGVI